MKNPDLFLELQEAQDRVDKLCYQLEEYATEYYVLSSAEKKSRKDPDILKSRQDLTKEYTDALDRLYEAQQALEDAGKTVHQAYPLES